ncbi:MAG: leucine dehydrogenase [Crocinitomicaceae bacterium]|nr:leucine dehydrogenase [Crocinitomicaceae bacterium]|tara:strand:+ start:2916 stop:4022 length:1107 start_codon:yes stop_codon:yes gene_type:complete
MNVIEKDQSTASENAVLAQMFELGHEQVVFCNDKATGLRAIIGIHNTVLGPALGGTRMWNYASEEEALRDVMRLSRGMTYKAAVSGLNLGGGKAVIIGDARTQKNEALMRRFGKFVDSLAGKYITAEDVGMTTLDMEYIHNETEHVVGIPETLGGGGDPSPVTAYGVYMGMKASAKQAWGNDLLNGKKIVVQGVGNVGSHLIDYAIKEGAKVWVSDIFEDKIKAITDKYPGVKVLQPHEIFDAEMDIYAPCALGATLNDDTINRLKCQVVSGAANNQLLDEEKHGNLLVEKGIFYAPDFLINAGGVINCFAELEGYNRERAIAKTEHIYDTTLNIYKLAADQGINTNRAAMQLAEKRISDIGKVKLGY